MGYLLLPFEFKRRKNGDVLLVNECGDYVFLGDSDFEKLTAKSFGLLSADVLHRLESRNFISEESHLETALTLAANKYRSRREYLATSTALHMMVVTLRCNHRCEYCQVSSEADDACKYDMKPETATRIVDLIFHSPSDEIKIEFQGGDALLNWPAVMAAVHHAEELNALKKKKLEFVICTNMYALTDSHLDDIVQHKIMISTSLDGPKWLHDKHRILRTDGSSYDKFLENLQKARQKLNQTNCGIGALMTATIDSLDHIEEIIDEYVRLGFEGIFFRSLNPYGDAASSETANLYYSPERYVESFKRGLAHILELNRRGIHFVEYYTALLLKRILTPYPTGFVDLQSPAGAGISGVIYDYNGDVYPADEARMLARMGNEKFKMGNALTDDYKTIFLSQPLKDIVARSCVETIPGCTTCAYRTYCGVDVFRNFLESGDISNVRSDSFFCRKQTLLFDYLFEKIEDPDFLKTVGKWIWS